MILFYFHSFLLFTVLLPSTILGVTGKDDGSSWDSTPQQIGDVQGEENGRYVVKYVKGSQHLSSRMKIAALKQKDTHGKSSDSILTYGKFLPQDNAEIMYLKDLQEVQEMENKDYVEYVELDQKVYLSNEEIPYGIKNVKSLTVPDDFVSNRKVCIIDTGYDLGHEDLPSDPSIVTGYEGDLSFWDWYDDGHGHGTHVAGTIAAIGNNDIGVVGVNGNGQIRLHIVRVFSNQGYWSWKSELVAAVEECQAQGSHVVNMSLGSLYFSQLENDAYQRIANDGVLLVAAAGNNNNDAYSYPASYTSVMSVAALDSENNRAYFSTYNDQVDIAAPGLYVKSTLPQNKYGVMSGTSMATPHVAGVAALIWSHSPNSSAREIREILEETAQDLGPIGRDDYYGHGLVRADLAVELLLSGNFTLHPTQTPTMSPIPIPGYCNYQGCNGIPAGGEWCNENMANCEGNCEGTWCPPITSSPTSAPTSTFAPSISAGPSLQPTEPASNFPSLRASTRPTSFPSTSSPTVLPGYCNYRGCNGIPDGGDFCNANQSHCENQCQGTWCNWNNIAPTKNPSLNPTSIPTSSPTNNPSVAPSKTPTLPPYTEYPSLLPTVNSSESPTTVVPTEYPTITPTNIVTFHPSNCVDEPSNEFFFKMDDDPVQPIFKTCDWLSTRTEKKRKNTCEKKTDSYDGVGPAREVCKVACGTCDTYEPSTKPSSSMYPSQHPVVVSPVPTPGPSVPMLSEEPTVIPSVRPTLNPSVPTLSVEPTVTPSTWPTSKPTYQPTNVPTSSGTCCSQNFKTCMDTSWCYNSMSNCEECGGILITGAPLECIARWGECTWNTDGCCAPANCQGNQYYRQCLT